MPPATAPSWKIGRNMAMTIPPTTTPRKVISSGSIRDVSAATVAYVILCPRLPDQLAERIEALQHRDFL